MVDLFQKIKPEDVSFHKDLRFGLGLISFRDVVNRFKQNEVAYPTIRLGRKVSFEYGKGLKEEERNGGEYPVMGSNGIVGYHDNFLVEGPCIIVGRKGSAGEINYVENNCYPIDTTFYIRQKDDDYIPKFLYYLLSVSNLKKLALFKGVPGLNRYDAYEIRIPLVEKSKQKEILERISPLEDQIKDLTNLLQEPSNVINKVFSDRLGFNEGKFNELRTQKTFHAQLTDFSNNRDVRFSSKFHSVAGRYLNDFLLSKTKKKVKEFLLEPIVLGTGISPNEYNEHGKYLYISMADIKSWSFDSENCKRIDESFYENNVSKSVRNNDIILARSGEGTIGKVAIIDDNEIEGVFADFTMRIRLKGLDPLFAYYYFRSELFQYLVYINKKGLGNNTNIFPSQIQEFPMLDFSTKHQASIVEEIKMKLDRNITIHQKIEGVKSKLNSIIENAIKTNKTN